MKKPKLGDYILWDGKPARIIGQTDQKTVYIENLEYSRCPHCDKILGKEQFSIIPTSPLFQKNAEPLQTMGDDLPTTFGIK